MSFTKYGNKPFWWNSITGTKHEEKINDHCQYWDSILEFSVYCELRKIFPATSILRQHPILYKPATASYAEQVWKCDFRVLLSTGDYQNIEVKGKWICSDSAAMSDFHKTLMFLDFHNPDDYSRLIITSDKTFRIDKQWQTLQLPQLIQRLKKSS